MQSERFRQLVDAKGPFVSVYFDDSHDTQDAAAQLGARLRDVRGSCQPPARGRRNEPGSVISPGSCIQSPSAGH